MENNCLPMKKSNTVIPEEIFNKAGFCIDKIKDVFTFNNAPIDIYTSNNMLTVLTELEQSLYFIKERDDLLRRYNKQLQQSNEKLKQEKSELLNNIYYSLENAKIEIETAQYKLNSYI